MSLSRVRCAVCGGPSHEGRHALTPSEAEAYPLSQCPKCSGGTPEDWRARCVVGDRVHYRCACGVTWSESRAPL